MDAGWIAWTSAFGAIVGVVVSTIVAFRGGLARRQKHLWDDYEAAYRVHRELQEADAPAYVRCKAYRRLVNGRRVDLEAVPLVLELDDLTALEALVDAEGMLAYSKEQEWLVFTGIWKYRRLRTTAIILTVPVYLAVYALAFWPLFTSKNMSGALHWLSICLPISLAILFYGAKLARVSTFMKRIEPLRPEMPSQRTHHSMVMGGANPSRSRRSRKRKRAQIA